MRLWTSWNNSRSWKIILYLSFIMRGSGGGEDCDKSIPINTDYFVRLRLMKDIGANGFIFLWFPSPIARRPVETVSSNYGPSWRIYSLPLCQSTQLRLRREWKVLSCHLIRIMNRKETGTTTLCGMDSGWWGCRADEGGLVGRWRWWNSKIPIER